ncbi:MAG: hypothetical protein NC413_04520 [Muribaculum sp.]|nr:hypothetical protein [Muribaculum sp.]
MRNKSSIIKVLGTVVTLVGLATNLLSDWVKDQQMNEKIEEKVNEAIAKRDNENEES